jgi:hypothetical protein
MNSGTMKRIGGKNNDKRAELNKKMSHTNNLISHTYVKGEVMKWAYKLQGTKHRVMA